ncbi:YcxB family protein [Porcipelethomonas sp.]|uniref:YcxB family protein n=1 Tax=Porcipelethomonas sp. TaxID=2981675 RepID=UPI003EFAD032
MVVKAENTINYEDIKKLNRCTSSGIIIMLCILIAAAVIFIAAALISGNNENKISFGFWTLVWCAVVYIYMFIINPKMTYSAFLKKYGNSPVKYEFNEKSVRICIENQDGSWDIRKNYRDMFKIHETDDYFFIHVKRNEAYILKKSGIFQGTAEEIRNAVFSEMGNKFVLKK